VDVQLVDGRNYRGIFYTATPFHGKKFELALKAATALDAAGSVTTDPAVQAGSTVLLAFSDLCTLTVSKKSVTANEGMCCCVCAPASMWLSSPRLSMLSALYCGPL
jgi:hypothetical protein